MRLSNGDDGEGGRSRKRPPAWALSRLAGDGLDNSEEEGVRPGLAMTPYSATPTTPSEPDVGSKREPVRAFESGGGVNVPGRSADCARRGLAKWSTCGSPASACSLKKTRRTPASAIGPIRRRGSGSARPSAHESPGARPRDEAIAPHHGRSLGVPSPSRPLSGSNLRSEFACVAPAARGGTQRASPPDFSPPRRRRPHVLRPPALNIAETSGRSRPSAAGLAAPEIALTIVAARGRPRCWRLCRCRRSARRGWRAALPHRRSHGSRGRPPPPSPGAGSDRGAPLAASPLPHRALATHLDRLGRPRPSRLPDPAILGPSPAAPADGRGVAGLLRSRKRPSSRDPRLTPAAPVSPRTRLVARSPRCGAGGGDLVSGAPEHPAAMPAVDAARIYASEVARSWLVTTQVVSPGPRWAAGGNARRTPGVDRRPAPPPLRGRPWRDRRPVSPADGSRWSRAGGGAARSPGVEAVDLCRVSGGHPDPCGRRGLVCWCSGRTNDACWPGQVWSPRWSPPGPVPGAANWARAPPPATRPVVR